MTFLLPPLSFSVVCALLTKTHTFIPPTHLTRMQTEPKHMTCRSPTPGAVTRRTFEAILAIVALSFVTVHIRETGANGIWFYCVIAGLSLVHILLTVMAEITMGFAVPIVADMVLAGLWFGGGIITFTLPPLRWMPALFALSFAQFILYTVEVVSGAIGLQCM